MQTKVILEGSRFKSTKDIHNYLAKALCFPSYYGSNLDALYDCLTSMKQDVLIIVSHMDNYKNILATIIDASKYNKHILIKGVN